MGTEDTKQSGGTNPQGTQTREPDATRDKGRTAATSTSSATSHVSTEGRTSDTQNGKSEKTLGLPHVDAPGVVSVRIPGADDAKEEKAAPKKSNKKKSENKPSAKNAQSIENLKLILQAITELLAMKVDPEWRMTESELDQICNPLSNILARHDMTDKLNEYGDWVSLLGACAMIIIPKMLLISNKKSKQKKVNLIANQSGTATPRSGDSSAKPNERPVQHAPLGDKQLPAVLTAITGF